MRQVTSYFFRIVIGIALCVQLIPVSLARDMSHGSISQPGDPQRWYQQDTSSPQDYYLTLKKEAGAAFQENMKSCKTKRHTSRLRCEREARAEFNQDLADAKHRAQEFRHSHRSHRDH